MGLFSGLLGGGKDTSFKLDMSGLDNAISGISKYTDSPTGMSRAATAGREGLSKDAALNLSNMRKSTGGGMSGNANSLTNNMYANNAASTANGGKYGAMASNIANQDIQQHDNRAYNTATRVLPNYSYKKQALQTGSDLAGMQADASATANTNNSLMQLGQMGAMMYGSRPSSGTAAQAAGVPESQPLGINMAAPSAPSMNFQPSYGSGNLYT